MCHTPLFPQPPPARRDGADMDHPGTHVSPRTFSLSVASWSVGGGGRSLRSPNMRFMPECLALCPAVMNAPCLGPAVLPRHCSPTPTTRQNGPLTRASTCVGAEQDIPGRDIPVRSVTRSAGLNSGRSCGSAGGCDRNAGTGGPKAGQHELSHGTVIAATLPVRVPTAPPSNSMDKNHLPAQPSTVLHSSGF